MVVVAVSEKITGVFLLAERRSADIVIGSATQSPEGKRRSTEIESAVGGTENAWESSPLRVGGATQDEVFHLKPVHRDTLIARVKASVPEISDVERDGGVAGKDIVRRTHSIGDVTAHVLVFIIEAFRIKQEIIHILVRMIGGVALGIRQVSGEQHGK